MFNGLGSSCYFKCPAPPSLQPSPTNPTSGLLTFSIFSSSILKNSCWLSDVWMLRDTNGKVRERGGRKLEDGDEEEGGGNKYIMRIFHYNPPTHTYSTDTHTHPSPQCEKQFCLEDFKRSFNKELMQQKTKDCSRQQPWCTHAEAHQHARSGGRPRGRITKARHKISLASRHNINILRWQLNGSSRLWTHQFSQIQTRFNNHFCLFSLELVRIKRLRLEFEWNNVQPDNFGLFFIRKIISHFSRSPFYWLYGSERGPPPQLKNLWLNSSFWTLKTDEISVETERETVASSVTKQKENILRNVSKLYLWHLSFKLPKLPIKNRCYYLFPLHVYEIKPATHDLLGFDVWCRNLFLLFALVLDITLLLITHTHAHH